jgi:hypothetical protein
MAQWNGGGWSAAFAAAMVAMAAGTALPVFAQGGEDEGAKLKPLAEVAKGYEKVAAADGSLYTMWSRQRDGSLLAELPRGWENQKFFIALTMSSGDEYAGLQAGDMYVYWKRIDNRMVLIEPNLGVRSTRRSGKQASHQATSSPIASSSTCPSSRRARWSARDRHARPARRACRASSSAGPPAPPTAASRPSSRPPRPSPRTSRSRWEMPAAGSRLQQFHYSISLIPEAPATSPAWPTSALATSRPSTATLASSATTRSGSATSTAGTSREARPGSQTLATQGTHHLLHRGDRRPCGIAAMCVTASSRGTRRSRRSASSTRSRSASRTPSPARTWTSIPKTCDTTSSAGSPMTMGTAIGPSRVHPLTGQILDADVVLTDGWIRHYWYEFGEVMPEIAMEGFSPETMAWLDQNPQWDPRIRLADPAKRDFLLAQRAGRGVAAYGGHPIALLDPEAKSARATRASSAPRSSTAWPAAPARCTACARLSQGKALDMGLMRLALDMITAEDDSPRWPRTMVKKATRRTPRRARRRRAQVRTDRRRCPTGSSAPRSSNSPRTKSATRSVFATTSRPPAIYTSSQINSDEVKGKKPWSSSVMDYCPTNFYIKDGKPRATSTPIGLGAV